jgi:CIC family chloride channel protein
VRLLLGGLGVGLLSVVAPEVWGSGLGTDESVLVTEWLLRPLLVVLGLKVLAIALTLGSGAVGGIFAPTLFCGALLGAVIGHAVHSLAPGLTAGPTAYAVVGMGSFLAATTHAPLVAIVMLFEMTLDYDIVPPLMLACVTAAYTAQGIDRESVYTRSLERQGELARRDLSLADVTVADLMRPAPATIAADAPFAVVADAFMQELQYKYLYVTDRAGAFLGAIALHDVKAHLADPALHGVVVAADLVRTDFPLVAASQRLVEALARFSGHDGERVPVVADLASRRLVGVLSKTDLILTLSQGARPVI